MDVTGLLRGMMEVRINPTLLHCSHLVGIDEGHYDLDTGIHSFLQ